MYYEEPILEIIYFSNPEVVTTSIPDETGSDWGDEYNPWA